MQRTRVDAEHAGERYLADQMSPQVAAEFEKLCLEHPEVYRDIEATLRLREGLAVLNDRGELDRLLRPHPQRGLIKAAAAVLLVSLLSWWAWNHREGEYFGHGTAPISALSTSHQSLPLAGSVVLVRSRETASETPVRLPQERSAIEFKIFPSRFIEHTHYIVTLALRRKDGLEPLGQSEVEPDTSRYLTVYVNSAQLTRGQYELTVTPQSPAANAADQDHFVIRLE